MIRNDGAPIPDDGIPVLTDVVEVAELSAATESASDPAGTAHTAVEAASLSLAMFPELEPGAVVELEREQAPFGVEAPFAPEESDPLPDLTSPHAFVDGLTAESPPSGYSALGQPNSAVSAPPVAARPAPVAFSDTAGNGPESRSEMETRIFEALAARLDHLMDERLAPVIEGSIEAAFAGVKAGLSASLNQAIREAVEQTVRDEFERRRPGDS